MDITEVSFQYPPTAWAGAEKVAHQIGLGLSEVGHNVRVITSSRSPKGARKYKLQGLRVKAYPTLFRFPFSVSTRTWTLRASLRNYGKGDVAHVHNVEGFAPLLFCSLKRGHQAVAWSAHDPTYMCGARMLPRDGGSCKGIGSHKCRRCENSLDRLRRRMVRKHMIPNVDAFIGTSKWIARLMLDAGFPKERVHVIHNGINLHNIKRSPVPDQPTMMYCGHIEPNKGLMFALKAYQLVLEEIPEARFVIVGDGPSAKEARRYADRNELEGVEWTGVVSDTVPYYKRARVIVHPSVIPENCSLVLLEAHAVGRPCVSTRVGGNHEIVHEGHTGFLTDPGQEGDLAHQLIRVLGSDDRAREMGRRARIRAEKHFNMDIKIQDHTKLFNRLVEK